MLIKDKLKTHSPAFSFEFFPPKDAEGVEALFETVLRLKAYEPCYVSVTYGAGGSTRQLTVDLVERIKRETGIEAMAHLTCVGASRAEIAEVLDSLRAANVRNILALRGDPPKGQTEFVKHENGFEYASELVEFIRARHADLCLVGACYPEVHPEAQGPDQDLEALKRKVDAGLDVLVTQLFFDNSDYFRFVERVRGAGIDIPVVAGIMPVTNLNQVRRFTSMCGANIPKKLLARLEETGGDVERVRAIGINFATRQCEELLSRGAPGIHFYTLNRSRATVHVLEALRPTLGSSSSLGPPSSRA